MNEQDGSDGGGFGRREFWRQLAASVLVVWEEMRGIAHQSIGGMADLPDPVLAEMVPVWREGERMEVRPDGLHRIEADGAEACLRPFGGDENLMLDQYACGRNLTTIADHVAARTGAPPDAVFQATKELFLELCKQGHCHPAAAHLQRPERRARQ